MVRSKKMIGKDTNETQKMLLTEAYHVYLLYILYIAEFPAMICLELDILQLEGRLKTEESAECKLKISCHFLLTQPSFTITQSAKLKKSQHRIMQNLNYSG